MLAWEPSIRLEARTHIAACLLQRRCPPSRDLIVMSTQMDVALAELADRTRSAPGIYYPGEDDLWGGFPTYNMLHPGYVYHPCTYHEVPSIPPGGTDISGYSLTDTNAGFLARWCAEATSMEILYDNGIYGVVNK